VTASITIGWAIALVVLLCVRSALPGDQRWWVWTCVTGVAMGLFGLWYVPFLKRRRARLAAAHAAHGGHAAEAGAASPAAPQASPGYVSRDSGSNTVSSTDTPGKSTRS
jgi:hypothetical protein